jgi:hypothetical protein
MPCELAGNTRRGGKLGKRRFADLKKALRELTGFSWQG